MNLSHRFHAVLLLAGMACCVAAPRGTRAQSLTWQRAQALTPADVNAGSRVQALTTDASGNVYAAGTFRGTIHLGPTRLVNSGGEELVVAKWSPTGQLLWVQQAGGPGQDYIQPTALAVEGASIYVGGHFQGTVQFGSLSLTNVNAAGEQGDGFVAKLTQAGAAATFAWVQAVAGAGEDQVTALAVQGSNLYVTGRFTGTAQFGPFPQSSAGGSDAFVAKITDDGTAAHFTWVLAGGSRNLDYGSALALSGPNVYVAGTFGGLATWGDLSRQSGGWVDGFIAKVVDAGSTATFTWVQQVGGADLDHAQVTALAVRESAVYVAGSFDGWAHLGTTSLQSRGSSDLFVGKLADAGATSSFQWAQPAGGPHQDYASGLAVRGTQLYLSGFFQDQAHFGPMTLITSFDSGPFVRTLNGSAFVALLRDAQRTGSFEWVQPIGGQESNTSGAVLAQQGAQVYVGGFFTGPAARLGHQTLSGVEGTETGYWAVLTNEAVLSTAAALQPKKMELYPNPAHDQVRVVRPTGTTSTYYTLLDALGRVVRTYGLPTSQSSRSLVLDLRGVPAGVYLLRLTSADEIASCRLAVENR